MSLRARWRRKLRIDAPPAVIFLERNPGSNAWLWPVLLVAIALELNLSDVTTRFDVVIRDALTDEILYFAERPLEWFDAQAQARRWAGAIEKLGLNDALIRIERGWRLT